METIDRAKVINTIQDTNSKILKNILNENLNIEDIENIVHSLNIGNKKALVSLLDKNTEFNAEDNFQIKIMTEYNFNRSYKNLAEAVANNDIEVATYFIKNHVFCYEKYEVKTAVEHAIDNQNEKMIDLLDNHGLLDINDLSTSYQIELDLINHNLI